RPIAGAAPTRVGQALRDLRRLLSFLLFHLALIVSAQRYHCFVCLFIIPWRLQSALLAARASRHHPIAIIAITSGLNQTTIGSQALLLRGLPAMRLHVCISKAQIATAGMAVGWDVPPNVRIRPSRREGWRPMGLGV